MMIFWGIQLSQCIFSGNHNSTMHCRRVSQGVQHRSLHAGPVSRVCKCTATSQSQVIHYTNLSLDTKKGISLFDITPDINKEIKSLGLQEGWVNVLSRHTTTAVTINENEARLMDDIRQWLKKLAPPEYPYLHNDLHIREAPVDWPGGHEAWVKQEPENAHSHLLSIMLGNTLTVPVTKGKMALGTWQSVLLVELDGPRTRTVGVQLVGYTAQQQQTQ